MRPWEIVSWLLCDHIRALSPHCAGTAEGLKGSYSAPLSLSVVVTSSDRGVQNCLDIDQSLTAHRFSSNTIFLQTLSMG